METGEVVPSSSFENQFRGKEIFDFPEGKISVVDITPKTLADVVPVLLAPGWSENYDTYRKTLKVGWDLGRRVLAVGYSRREGEVIGNEEYPKAELRKARLILGVLDKKGTDKVDVIAHSEGAINILIAAMIRPDKFRNIVLDKPAGLIGKNWKVGLIARFVRLMAQEAVTRPVLLTDSNNAMIAAIRAARYIAENPKRVLDELVAITSFDITDLMRFLHEKGIMISVISGVNDPLFPVRRQIKEMHRKGLRKGEKPPFEGYYSVKGGHNEISLHPEKHAALALNALDDLQWKRKKIEMK